MSDGIHHMKIRVKCAVALQLGGIQSLEGSRGTVLAAVLARAATGAAPTGVIVRDGGRSSIPETPMIEPRSRGVLDSRMRGNDRRVWRHTIGVIASVAKQSILSLRGEMDCFAPLAMTVRDPRQ